MRTLKLLITTHYLQISWHEINFKLSLVYILINEVGLWFYQPDHVTFSKNIFWSVLLPNLFHPNVNFIAGGKVGISSKILHVSKYF